MDRFLLLLFFGRIHVVLVHVLPQTLVTHVSSAFANLCSFLAACACVYVFVTTHPFAC